MNNKINIIRIIILVFSILSFVIFLLSGIYFFVTNNNNTWALSLSVSLINLLVTSILSFINLFVIPKKFLSYYSTDRFSDRKQLLNSIFAEINNGNSVIRITGAPYSGKSELLRHLYNIINNKQLLNKTDINIDLANKVYKKIGYVHFIDGERYIGNTQLFVKDIQNIFLKKRKINLLLIDNIYKIDNPNSILELINEKTYYTVIVIYTINHDIPKVYQLKPFEKKDIYELSSKYNLELSPSEIDNIFLSTQGNVGLINLVFNNYCNQDFIRVLNCVDDYEISIKAQRLIDTILKNQGIKKIAMVCSALNLCENSFDVNMLSQIIGYNISSIDMTKLVSTGLFTNEKNKYYTNDYISQIIRSIDYKTINRIVLRIIEYYKSEKDDKSISLLLLCKGSITESEVNQILRTLDNHSLNKSNNNIGYLMKMGQIYKEMNNIDFSSSSKHKQLKEKIIYEYANSLMYIGDYVAAKRVLADSNSPKTMFIKADLAHLQNNYDYAIGLFTVIVQNEYSNYHMAEIKLAHCYKHKGLFNESLEMLNSIEKDSPNRIKLRAKTDSLSLFILLNDFSGLREKIHSIFIDYTKLKDYQIATLKRYNAILYASDNQYDMAIKEINEAIDICIETDSRLCYNCYYIRGEINRHFDNHEKSFDDFLHCYRVSLWNEDYNLRSMSVVSLELIKHHIKHTLPKYDISEILDACDNHNMPYNLKLLKTLIHFNIINKPLPDSYVNTYYIVP